MKLYSIALLTLALLWSPLTPAPACAAEPSVDALLASMSLEHKIGQMMLVAFKGPGLSPEISEMIRQRSLGGVILYSSWGNVENVQQVADLNAALQADAAKTPAGIGLFVGIDQEGGPVVRLRDGVTLFPSQMAIAATGNREHARTAARIMAKELAALGINTTFSPVADVNSNPANPVIGIRSFGSDPNTVSRLTAATVEAYAQARMICTPKHFPGHGDTSVDSHLGLPLNDHDKKTLERVDFAPFRAAFAAKAPAVMTAHVEVPALDPRPDTPATLSQPVLEGVLRRQMRFDGLIVTDSLGMGALSKGVGTVRAAVLAAKAGADVLLFGADIGHEPQQQIEAYEALLAAARSGELPQARIDQAVGRILAVKQRYGILQAASIGDKSAAVAFQVGLPEDRQAALEIAQDSITLLRDRTRMLPLKPADKALVLWPERNGFDPVASLSLPKGATLMRTSREPSAQELREAADAAAGMDKVVVFTYDATRNQAQQNLVRTMLAMKPQNVIHVSLGGPYDAGLFPTAPTCLATYGDVPVSIEALCRALAGTSPMPGRLPVRLQ
ncbi:glycoside hydrolase family 3 protein [Fundidesulfovibrio soli]|uniref:glycoside hydrolase family 3 protein n=1 Tax=Fundidesulfovibrio soli TaxID=2922716 RepID=UPI001FB017AD|nr:glycoside hydrolase family 3 protein [Fundidesulfovibrio soli]